MGKKIQWICLLFTVFMIMKVSSMSAKEKENEIDTSDPDEHTSFKEGKEPSGSSNTVPPQTTEEIMLSDTTVSDSSDSPSEPQPTTPAPKRDSFLQLIDDLFKVPLKVLKMFSNLLSRSLEVLTSKTTPQ